MCFSKKQKTEQKSTSELSDWSKGQWDTSVGGIFDTIDDFNTNTPFKPFTGEMVAGLSTGEQKARDFATQNMGQTGALYDEAEGMVREGATAEWNPTDVSYRTFDPARVEARLNPFRTNVVDAAGEYIDEERDRQITANQARATASGAYGGSRHGVADGELMRTAAMDKGNLNANLLYSGWNDAVAGDERESQGVFGADTFNAGRTDDAAKWKADNAYKGAGALSGLADAKQGSWMREVQMMEGLGATEREIEQAKMLAEKALYDEEAADAWDRMKLELQTRIGVMGATPMLVNTTGSSTSKINDPMGALSGLMQGIGSLKQIK